MQRHHLNYKHNYTNTQAPTHKRSGSVQLISSNELYAEVGARILTVYIVDGDCDFLAQFSFVEFDFKNLERKSLVEYAIYFSTAR